jgi:hypothetical protein
VEVGTVLAVVATILAFAVLLPFVQGAKRKATLELLREELGIEREARVEQERRCQAEIARLAGRLDLVTADFAQTIAHEVVRAMRDQGVIK